MRLFVVSDIHGMFEQFEQLLTHWKPEDKLVLLGDLVDRGPQSLQVVRKVMQLKETYEEQIVYCMGNHDQMFLNYIASPMINRMLYFPHGGRQTMASFLNTAPSAMKELNAIEQAYYVQENFQKEISFLESGQLNAIIGKVLLTHAGFESTSSDLADTTDDDFLWIRDHYLQPNQTNFINIFGHTPTRYIHQSDDIWVSTNQTYIGIDGGCVFGGQLNAVLLTEQGTIIETFSIKGEV